MKWILVVGWLFAGAGVVAGLSLWPWETHRESAEIHMLRADVAMGRTIAGDRLKGELAEAKLEALSEEREYKTVVAIVVGAGGVFCGVVLIALSQIGSRRADGLG